MVTSTPVLSESRSLRFSAFTLFYVAQGIPIGLLDVAMPAWLAAQGYSAAQIGSFVALIGLPWAFKLVAGPFMDRFGFPAMGRRRPWVLIAQIGLMLMLALLALVPDPQTQLLLLMAAGVLVNACAATQDVAVDGMAIDILQPEERGRANAFMAFGQVGGIAATGAIAGGLLSVYGLFTTALTASVAVAFILVVVIACRERVGERLLPWSSGESHPDAADLSESLTGLFGDLLKALLLPMSIIITASVFSVRVAMGVFLAAAPVFAVQELGYSSADYSQAYGTLIGVGAVAGLAVGPLVDRFGVKTMLLVALIGGAFLVFSFMGLESHWSTRNWVLGWLVVYLLIEQVVFICLIAQYMSLTWQKIAATQFAVYMALANLGRSTGAGVFAYLSLEVNYPAIFAAIGALYLLGIIFLLAFNERRHLTDLKRLDQS